MEFLKCKQLLNIPRYVYDSFIYYSVYPNIC